MKHDEKLTARAVDAQRFFMSPMQAAIQVHGAALSAAAAISIVVNALVSDGTTPKASFLGFCERMWATFGTGDDEPLEAKFFCWAQCKHVLPLNETFLSIDGINYTHWSPTKEAAHDETDPQYKLLPLEEIARTHWLNNQTNKGQETDG